MYASGKREHGDYYCKQIISFPLFFSEGAEGKNGGFLVPALVVDTSWKVCW